MARVPRLSALILGGANTLPVDRAAALDLFTPDLVVACNHAARDEPGRVDHVCSMHPELMELWMRQRAEAGRPPVGRHWHARHRIAALESTPIESWGGSSGLLCVRVALELGCDRIVLAGVPMSKMARHYNDDAPWNEARQYWSAWERVIPKFRDKVRSMSGYTLDWLGAPTRQWLNVD